MSLESLYKLSILVNMIDRVTGPAARISSAVEGTTSKFNLYSSRMADMARDGVTLMGTGYQLADAAIAPVKATFSTQDALAELSSLGVEHLGALEDAATSFTSTWAGTSKAEFLTAAYDIKSGIASLTDEGVAGYTEIAGVTAKATKASVGEMTNLFATGYGIYKDYYNDLSDLEFGQMFSAGIADSVRAFKTSGSGMAQAISALGGTATSARVPLEEQLSILGMLQATMSGSEAGTKYTAFLNNAAKAGQELGLKFTDTNGQLNSMPEILGAIQGKFGDVLTASDKLELQKAFGTVEAVKLIDLLYSKTDHLQGNILTLYDSMAKGMSITEEMANKINAPPAQGWELLKQKMQATAETVGNAMLPRFIELMDKVDGMANKIAAFAQAHPELTSNIMYAVAAFGAFLATLGAGKFVVGMLSSAFLAFGKIKPIVLGVLGAAKYGMFLVQYGAFNLAPVLAKLGAGFLKGAGAALKFGAALLANPITWIVIGILALIAAIYLLWKNWDKVSAALGAAWTVVKDGFLGGVQHIKDGFTAAMEWINAKIDWFKDSGKRIVDTLVEGILSVASKPVEAVKNIFGKVRDLLPFSDAKTGPLSDLTLSGQRIFETINSGMELSADLPANTMANAFDEMDTNVDAPGSGSSGQGNTGRRTTIQQVIFKVFPDDIESLKKVFKLIEEMEDGIDSDDGGPVPAF